LKTDPQNRLTPKEWAKLIADAIVAKNPGVFVSTVLCNERHRAIEARLKTLTQLSFGIFIGVSCLVMGLAVKILWPGTP